ncbi:hypothetical protein TBLA_0B02750 [Henningerozyma blattae CBS 6284]|uniref:Tyr recombinase Flp-type domain-containing protein n=1 Tax=Henningerozyma blattae (strain ATCC 34711 / CBS 6284 / DSM 70876 / NBRC 10599 / NRRL Y-10934 / UCD 77-7) TaxID=1071380 RepID=I2GYB5_HENB6|nr:hypothetical protein TBLA_0B02750 [Tetrapisispora blattae CBS 6284]CCH59117.1 hypothetical protein TBLA_0B02750 [Tetrapisispora blattae CBS 6284]
MPREKNSIVASGKVDAYSNSNVRELIRAFKECKTVQDYFIILIQVRFEIYEELFQELFGKDKVIIDKRIFGSLLSYYILHTFPKIKRVTYGTYRKNKAITINSLEIDYSRHKIQFKYRISGNRLIQLQTFLNEQSFFKPWKFRILSDGRKEENLFIIDKNPLKNHNEPNTNSKHIRNSETNLKFNQNVLEYLNKNGDPWDIYSQCFAMFENHSREMSCIRYKLISVLTFTNACRISDLIRLDPSSFHLKKNKYLGTIVCGHTFNTLNNIPRTVQFIPAYTRGCDMLQLLEEYLKINKNGPFEYVPMQNNKSPIQTTNDVNQKYQFFKEGVGAAYTKLMSVHPAHHLFKLKNAPKTDLGIYLMINYLNKIGLQNEGHRLGNWTKVCPIDGSELKKRNFTTTLTPCHSVRDSTRAIISGYYQISKYTNNNKKRMVRVHTLPEEPTSFTYSDNLQLHYGHWAKIVPHDVLAFLLEYSVTSKEARLALDTLPEILTPSLSMPYTSSSSSSSDDSHSYH